MSGVRIIDVRMPANAERRDYEVRVGEGLIDLAGAAIAPMLKRPFAAIVTDEIVAAAHGERLEAALGDAGVASEMITLPPGEATKSMAQLTTLMSQLLSLGVERSDIIIAFGGGVIGDLAGFAAALLRRGCRFVQIPTTLLAQVDSSVGGKTAVNAPEGKNLIGAFHQPSLVLADVTLLSTLPERELRAGYAEVVKYGAINDRDFFDWLEGNGGALLDGDGAARIHAVAHAVSAKAAIVARDEREAGERRLLNLGHTFGHALESVYGYSGALLHGEAVAAGMGLAFDYSVRKGICPRDDADALKRHLTRHGLPAGIKDLPATNADTSAARLTALMRQDKKMSGGQLALILARGIGEACVERAADLADVEAFLKSAGGQ